MQNKDNKTQPKKQTTNKYQSALYNDFVKASNKKRLGMIYGIMKMHFEGQLDAFTSLVVIKELLKDTPIKKDEPQPQAIKKGGNKCN